MRRVTVVVTLALSMLLLPSSAAASVWDPDDVDGPLDIRSVNVVPLRHDRLNLTISFWAPFHRSAIGHRMAEGVRAGFTLPAFGDYETWAYVVRRSGSIVLWHGDFGSSVLLPIPNHMALASTLTTSFLPWWIRTGEDTIQGVPYRAKSRVCPHRCIRDHTGFGVVS